MTTKEWLDRIDNLLDLQKEIGADTMMMNLTRSELVQLRIFINVIRENIKEEPN